MNDILTVQIFQAVDNLADLLQTLAPDELHKSAPECSHQLDPACVRAIVQIKRYVPVLAAWRYCGEKDRRWFRSVVLVNLVLEL